MTPINGTDYEHEITTIRNIMKGFKLLNAINIPVIKAYQKLNLLEQTERLLIEVKALMVEKENKN
jgi:hypothetical protein